MDDTRPIGFFDSGVGGITLLKPAHFFLPAERLIYYGDSAHAPYGIQPHEAILAHSLAAAEALMAWDIKMLVIACNTATSVAAEALRQRLPIPVVAVEPALKPASRLEPGGRVIVLATRATLSLPRFKASMAQYGHNAVAVPVFGLVERVEAGETEGPAIEACLRDALAPVLTGRPEAVVLGCTHYPFVAPVLARLLPAGSHILDGTRGVVLQMARLLRERGLARSGGDGQVIFRSSSPDPRAVEVMARLYREYTPQPILAPPPLP